VGSAFPIAFLSNPFTYIFLHIGLGLEATGICSGEWVLAAIQNQILGHQCDEVYIGTVKECASKNMSDDADQLHLGPGHPIKLPGFAENAPTLLNKFLESD
jgi:hypothetical protein